MFVGGVCVCMYVCVCVCVCRYIHAYIYMFVGGVCVYVIYICMYVYYTYYNKVRELTAVKVLHISLLNTTVVTFKVLPLGSYAPMPAPRPPFKTILELVL